MDQPQPQHHQLRGDKGSGVEWSGVKCAVGGWAVPTNNPERCERNIELLPGQRGSRGAEQLNYHKRCEEEEDDRNPSIHLSIRRMDSRCSYEIID